MHEHKCSLRRAARRSNLSLGVGLNFGLRPPAFDLRPSAFSLRPPASGLRFWLPASGLSGNLSDTPRKSHRHVRARSEDLSRALE